MRFWERSRFGVMPRPAGEDRPGLSVANKRRLQELQHQQLWYWGRDMIARPECRFRICQSRDARLDLIHF